MPDEELVLFFPGCNEDRLAVDFFPQASLVPNPHWHHHWGRFGRFSRGLHQWAKHLCSDSRQQRIGRQYFLYYLGEWVGELSQEEWEKMLKRNKEIETGRTPFRPGNCRSCVDVGGETKAKADLKHEGEEMFDTTIYGSSAEMVDITNMDLSEGRFFAPL